jgi:DNA-binding NarL/FixJ family response regulator
MTIQLGLVDDHIITRRGLKTYIELNKQIRVSLEAGNGKELFQSLGQADILPDIILLDISMPKMNGFEAIQQLQEKYPSIKVLIFSMITEEDTVMHMIRRGASGFISKSADPEIIVKAILTVAKAGYYIGNLTKKEFFRQSPYRAGSGSFIGNHPITPKELEFIRLASSNLSYHEIADRLKISPKTLENYRDSLFHKLEIKNRAALVYYAFKSGLIDSFSN